MVRVRDRVMVRVRVCVADFCIQTAGESDKIRINHVIKTDQWCSAPQICPVPHFVVSHLFTFGKLTEMQHHIKICVECCHSQVYTRMQNADIEVKSPLKLKLNLTVI